MVKSVWIKYPHTKKNCPITGGCMSCSSYSDSKMKKQYNKNLNKCNFVIPSFIKTELNTIKK